MGTDRLCVVCRHFNLNPDTPDFSELTPGDHASVGCDRGLWPVLPSAPDARDSWNDYTGPYQAELRDINLNVFRRLIATAKTCPSFELADNGELEDEAPAS